MVQDTIARVTARIVERSRPTREAYLTRMEAMARKGPRRGALGCANLAHGFAACGVHDKAELRADIVPNLGIVTAYNDMLSAHQPYEGFPAIIKQAAREAGGVAQVAGGVPAMCDGVTQGRAGMEMSLFSRDVIALSASIALSHDMFDAAVFLGICDKIVPGLVIAAQAYGHLPAVFIPAGPMPSGISNDQKSKVRQLYAEGKVDRAELLEAEAASYHSAGTCTFYGTANSNQMLMEAMGLHLPGASFVNPNTPLRDALTAAAAKRALAITALGNEYTPASQILDERAFVNGVVALHATGGSTNHVIHLVAMARAGGIILTLEDFGDLSKVVPLLTRIYPNGSADVNHFSAAGGTGYLIGELLKAGLLNPDAKTVTGAPVADYAKEPYLDNGELKFRDSPSASLDPAVLRPFEQPFSADGGLKVLSGNLGSAVIKISAVAPERHLVRAPALIFHAQEEVEAAFKAGELNRDFIAVVRFQGVKAIGMPELHKLTPILASVMAHGHQVALVTDGRMSGASGKVPAAIHVSPEAQAGGPIGKVREGDMITLDAAAGTLMVEISPEEFERRELATCDLESYHHGYGRELFHTFRMVASGPELGASSIS
ncbi:6-phosphogluconate dehydratase [Methylocella silvestris BL2]|uniref:Phosphogluconate dehydratase n=1 Tax=Methylocella silvestris (strain DSM 15510 / CIP 108128 / LMG 27833 / NCIMB 13906 / BL2) TaxID=395965 RepID=B8ENG2_METSB|nr:phosphogluconate dehydratase [Methylocella silvestris]ACK50093.1 6-phosphogluconate dehydratase [Methylocella silvestris BL2]